MGNFDSRRVGLSFLCTLGIVTSVNCIWQSLVQKQICQMNKCSVEEFCFI